MCLGAARCFYTGLPRWWPIIARRAAPRQLNRTSLRVGAGVGASGDDGMRDRLAGFFAARIVGSNRMYVALAKKLQRDEDPATSLKKLCKIRYNSLKINESLKA
jgi:hypothetical protein